MENNEREKGFEMKPDWKDAPEWANWLAHEIDGTWYWFEAEPCMCEEEWYAIGSSKFEKAGFSENEMLEPRPGNSAESAEGNGND